MKAFKEILAMLTGTILMFWGLATILIAELLNGIILIGILMIAGGISCFLYIGKGIYQKWR